MSDLPAGLYRHGRRYRCKVYRDGKRVWHDLGDDLHAATERLAEIRGEGTTHTMAGLIARYKRDVLPHKAPKTRKEQTRQADRLARVFGALAPGEIKPTHAIRYLEARESPVAANREIALLRHVLTKAVHWGLLERNLLLGINYRNPERQRTRVVEPAEIRYVMRRAPQRERYLIWLVYLTGLRRGDALKLNAFSAREDGLHVREGKTGKAVRIAWTPSLAKVCRRLQQAFGNHWFGISASGADTAWQRLRKRLAEDGYDLWQLKDLRAAHAQTVEDAGGDATRQLGHSSRAITSKHYLRAGRKIAPIR